MSKLQVGQRIRVFEVVRNGSYGGNEIYAEHHETDYSHNEYGTDLISEYSHPLAALHVNASHMKQVGTLIIKKIK
jgi:hypothetical protein